MSADFNTKVIVLELDGATWTVADRLIATGKLPHLTRIKREGVWGVLRSLEPMISSSLWTTIHTGKTAAEHGIESFSDNARSLRCKRLWDILDEVGFSVGLMGTLATWPPRPVAHGFVIPDDIIALDSQTYPPHLKHLQEFVLNARLRQGKIWRYFRLAWQLLQTGVHPAQLVQGGLLLLLGMADSCPLDMMWRKILAVEAIKTDAFFHLYRRYRPQFAAYHYHATDTLGHFYWQYYEPNAFVSPPSERDVGRYRQVIPQAYIQADQLLGRLLRMMDRDTTLVLVSDHGQAAYPEMLAQSFLNLITLTEFLGIQHYVTPVRIANEHYLHFQNPDFMQQTEQLLQQAFITPAEQSVFHRITRNGSCLSFALVPGILVKGDEDKDERIVFPGRGEISTRALKVQTGPPIVSRHTLDGLVVLYGHNVHPGKTLDNASILDVTPTMLTLFGLPVARDMKGQVWWEVLELDRARTERYVDSYEDVPTPHDAPPTSLTLAKRALLLDRLRDLGYI